ncbi:MAG: outer membrane protein assembly factor BamD [Cellvibrionaceae bacterium]
MKSIRILPAFIVISLCSLLILGCSSTKKINFANFSEQKLYDTAQGHLKKRRFILAVEALQKLESDFPFGKYANSSQLALIYAYYKSSELPLADSAASRYIRLHPNHPDVDYAYYMRGLVAFPTPSSFFQSALGTDLSKRDMKSAKASFVYFSELVRRFPNSQYSPDAIERMNYIRNLLSRHEINVANYYLERGAFLAAANRGRYVVENYQTTPAVPDALAMMIQSYHLLNMPDLAQESLGVLTLNYPDYPALNDKGEFDYKYHISGSNSLLKTITFGLVDTSRPPGFDSRKQYGEF